MTNLKKLHVGSGTVYLNDWINVDVRTDNCFLAKDRPDLVSKYCTDEKNYYSRHKDMNKLKAFRRGPMDQEYVCDEYGSFFDLPASTWTVDEILSRQTFEHLSIADAHRALDEIDRKLVQGGVLRIDVPDHEETMKMFLSTGNEFFIRHLLGPRKNDYGFHMMSYTREGLRKLVEDHGFVFIEEEPNIHPYPAFCFKFIKPTGMPAYEYALKGAGISAEISKCEVGPGNFPWPLADTYIDINRKNLDEINKQHGARKNYILANVENLQPIPDKTFDFVFCSHVLEHLADPPLAAREISRIGKNGTVVVPSIFKDSLMLFDEPSHTNLFIPTDEPNTLGFIKINDGMRKQINSFTDIEAQKAICRIMRSGPNSLEHDQRVLRKWFYQSERHLDIVLHWKGLFKVREYGLLT
jgi:ubiquinone/menaquinone biosynthesis C-methylase UbiE